ncbi:hypothetical protein Y1Q_0022062 [Alligator mississippiensis]|uniref:Uncharacterized protein n=1 Tax=Alligator mississippiensis TaxID=8496 RepID=A0A151NLX0_ALLMI|nr:hypothetical protein Y1Q_0022062 [Alligator mississippiensis]
MAISNCCTSGLDWRWQPIQAVPWITPELKRGSPAVKSSRRRFYSPWMLSLVRPGTVFCGSAAPTPHLMPTFGISKRYYGHIGYAFISCLLRFSFSSQIPISCPQWPGLRCGFH